jgi:hypothetical protein
VEAVFTASSKLRARADKRGVIGSYHHLSEDHLDSYLQEFSWRYNRRGMQPFMFNTLLSELTKKKPLTYKKLTRETF